MRKIEKQLLCSLNNGVFKIYLHGNHIADWFQGDLKVNLSTRGTLYLDGVEV